MEKGAALEKLGSITVRMITDPSSSNAEDMMELLPQISPIALQALQKGILGALTEPLVNARIPLDRKRYVLECMTEILCHTRISNLSIVWTVYSTTCMLIYDDVSGQIIEAHEELKLSAVKCINTALKQATSDVITQLYTKSSVPKLSKCALICKRLVQSEKYLALRLAAINCIMTLAYIHDEADEHDVVLRKQVGDVVMFILPGILALFRDVIIEGDTTPHEVTVLAIRAWSRMIAIVMEDFYATDDEQLTREYPDIKHDSTSSKELNFEWRVTSKEQLIEKLNAATRSQKWYQAAAEIITKSVKSISKIQLHSQWKVRKELALGCKTLVFKCSRNMQPAAGYLLDILIVLAHDEAEDVLTISQEGLRIFADKLHKHSGRHLLVVVEENFYSVITSLPRFLKGIDDGRQLATLNLLVGYMKLLGKEKLSQIFLSVTHLNRFLSMLIQAFELDNFAVHLLDECSIKDVNSSHFNTNVSWRMFKNTTDPTILVKLVDICKLLAIYTDLNMLSHCLLDIFTNSVSSRKEVTIILNEILSSEFASGSESRYHVIENVLDVYIEPNVWYVPFKTCLPEEDITNKSCTTAAQARNNLIQACLLLEGIGKMLKSLRIRSGPLLKKVLYPMLERAGNSQELVALFSLEALQSAAAAHGNLNNVAHLINSNLDYLSCIITRKMRREDEKLSTLNVLQVMIKHCSAENLPMLKCVVEKAIKQSYGTCQTTNAVLLLEVLHPLMASLRLLQTEIKTTIEDSQIKYFPRIVQACKVVDELHCYHKHKEAAVRFEDQDQTVMEENKHQEKKQNVQSTGKNTSLTELSLSVMQRCVHLISTRNRKLTLLVLSTLKEGLVVLKDQENEVLQIVHQIWTPLLTKLCDLSDYMIARYSFQLLLVIAKTAKCFIRKRALENVLPFFCQFLSSSIDNSRKKDLGHTYRFTQQYKLQLEILQGLGSLATNVQFQEREMWQILQAVAPYLSLWQPLPFQSACVELYVQLAILNRGAVWLKMMELVNKHQKLEPRYTDLQHINIVSEGNEEYTKNVLEILYNIN